jgi:hypothetical protein
MAGKPSKRKSSTVKRSREAEAAFKIERKIVDGCSAIRKVWVALAAYLSDFHEGKMWEQLGHDSLEEWLGAPEIGLSRSHVYALIEAYRELVVKRGLSDGELAKLEATKIAQVLPALRRGDVDLETALADCESLSRSALREKYGHALPASRKPLVKCEDCGAMRQVHDPEAEAADPNQTSLVGD